MTWRPIHPKHAIERTRIAVQFRDPLSQKTIQTLGQGFDTAGSAFGFEPKQNTQSQTISISADGRQQFSSPSPTLGWQAVRTAQTTDIVEAIVVDPRAIAYENVEYTRWNDFWGRSWSILSPLIESANSTTHLQLFSLEYFDRFFFDGHIVDASPKGLIAGNVLDMVSQQAGEGREHWHIYRGWFDTIDGIRVLVNHNIDSSDLIDPLSKTLMRSIAIYTKIERRNVDEVVDFGTFAIDMQKMHAISKSILSQSLTKKSIDTIGLNE